MTPTHRRAVPAAVAAAALAGVVAQAWAGTPVTAEALVRMVLFALPVAGIYAISAAGLVVVHSTTGIFNLAQGAIGMVCAFLFWELSVDQELPRWLALVAVVGVCAPVIGIVLDRVLMRRLARAPLTTQLIATVGLLAALLGTSTWVWDPNHSYPIEGLGGEGGVRIAGVLLTWHRTITIAVAVALALALRHLMQRTRLGVAMRAVVDDPDLASLYGVRPGRVSSTAWVIGSVCAALAGILIAPEIGNMSAETLAMLIINSFAAAVVGRLRGLPMTYVGALAVGLTVSFSTTFLEFGSRWAQVPNLLPAIALFVALLVLPQQRINLGRVVRTYPMEAAPTARTSVTAAAVLVGAVVVLGPLLSDVNLGRVTLGIVTGVVLLGLVPLLGWSGIPFLAPYALAGFGAWFTWKLQGEVPGVVALVGAAAGTAAVGVVAALPALRLRGLYIALSSITFALVTANLILPLPEMLAQYRTVERPTVAGLDLDSPQSFAVFAAVAYAVLALGLTRLRRSRFGRQAIAARDSEAAASCVGISLVATKVAVFALAGAVCGIGGGLLAQSQRFASQEQFPMMGGLAIILSLTIWGIGTTSGPVVAGLTASLLVAISQDWATGDWAHALELAGPGLAALALVAAPRGQIIVVVAHARQDPLATVLRLGGLALGIALGVGLGLPGLVGVSLALLLYLALDATGSVVSEHRRRAAAAAGGLGVHGDPAVEGVDQGGLGISAPLTRATSRLLDRRLGLGEADGRPVVAGTGAVRP